MAKNENRMTKTITPMTTIVSRTMAFLPAVSRPGCWRPTAPAA
jgi:hypothetical protein